MKILLDECVPLPLRKLLPGHDCQSAQEMGWKIVDINPVEGRVEATDTTFWFGFKDDIVIRITASGSGGRESRVDVRSVSRVGRSDVGTNTKRIEKYLKKLSR